MSLAFVLTCAVIGSVLSLWLLIDAFRAQPVPPPVRINPALLADWREEMIFEASKRVLKGRQDV